MAESSSDQDLSQKTEEPTEHRLQEARKKGQIIISREVNNALILFTFTISVLFILPVKCQDFARSMLFFICNSHDIIFNSINLHYIMQMVFKEIAFLLVFPFAMLMIAALAGGLVQTNFLLTTEQIKPKLEKISLLKGLKRILSKRALVEFTKSIIKLIILSAILFFALRLFLRPISQTVAADFAIGLSQLHQLSMVIMGSIVGMMIVVAALDYWYQYYSHRKSLRMTWQELKDEHKQLEGDPKIKSKLKSMRLARARQRMMAAVPKATVVITNPQHYAVALKYEHLKMNAPVVVAKGMDSLALRIKQIAKKHNVPVIENPPLAQVLYREVEVNKEIKEKHYNAVANIIRVIMNLAS